MLDVCQLLFECFDFLLQPLFFEHVLNRELQRFFLERFCEVVRGSHLHGFNNSLDLTNAGQGNDRHRRVNGLDT